MNIGAEIRAARKSLKLNQQDFGEVLGVSQSAISNWENGMDAPDPAYVEQIAVMGKNPNLAIAYFNESGVSYTVQVHNPPHKTVETLQQRLSEMRTTLAPLESITASLKKSIRSLEIELAKISEERATN